MTRLRWSSRAARDFKELLNYIGTENPANAVLVRERILRTLESLESFSLGSPGPNGSFKLYIAKTSYFVIYRHDDIGGIGIRAFVHASRNWEQIDWENL